MNKHMLNNNYFFTCKPALAHRVAGLHFFPHYDGYSVARLRGYRRQQSEKRTEQSCLSPSPCLTFVSGFIISRP